MAKREEWGSRFGLILAMAGNAIGLGNFLRFPVQAAQNGGGAFMIPYFAAFILLAIPLMWVEWTIGRNGGKYSHGSLPGMFDVMWNNKVAKYLGAFGLFISTIIMIYYTVIVSWMLGFSFYSITGDYFIQGMDVTSMGEYLTAYQTGGADGTGSQFFDSMLPGWIFLLITVAFNFYILSKGISGGIEKFAKIALPLLFVFATTIAIFVFYLGTPDPINYPERSVWHGLAFIWNPDLTQLGNSKIWLAAAGQVFFTLSVGMGTLQAYASYLKKKQDIALSGIATASINEFAEVILGGIIAIPIAVAFFGLQETQAIADGGTFNLGIVSMSVIFQKLGISDAFGQAFGFMWFFLLFFAGITSSVAMAQPLISFLKEQFDLTHKRATTFVGIFILVAVHLVFFYLQFGFMDEMDYWAGTFMLVIVALIEVIIFAWIFGAKKGWVELNKGGDITVPKIFIFVVKYVTPIYLLFILGFWTVQDAIPTLMMDKQNSPEFTISINDVNPKSYDDILRTEDLPKDIETLNVKNSIKFDFKEEINEINKQLQMGDKDNDVLKSKILKIFMIENVREKYQINDKSYEDLPSKDELKQVQLLFTKIEASLVISDNYNSSIDKSLKLISSTDNNLIRKCAIILSTYDLFNYYQKQQNIPYMWGSRIFMLLLLLTLFYLIHVAWKRNASKPDKFKMLD
ncbi:sodium-dependent transporter [Candidatus Kapabacteria bacterium]|nr:sodium-dependent transporter [Candidatus Kapabacteria bacterium]